MKLRRLINCNGEYADIEITDICHDASCVKQGSLFFCLKGSNSDGHDYAQKAEKAGAAAIICERDINVNVPVIKSDNTRRDFALAASAFYGHPSRKLKMFGITGTNGKTTTSYVLAEILKKAGEKVGLIGTNCVRYLNCTEPATLTTPDPTELYKILDKMLDEGITAVVMEVSAHALALHKTDGLLFDVAGFTNLSRDHLDYFKDMKSYAEAKLRLFTPSMCKCAAINADDGLFKEQELFVPVLTYGRNNPSDVFGINLKMSVEGLSYVINVCDDVGKVKFALPGAFNMYNTLCAAAMARLAGVRFKHILAGIRSVIRVDGRFNVINGSKFSVIVDFAHTDDGLRNIITSVREFAPARIITVFGCGGNRDKSKRAAMGEIAATLSDHTVITSDNPRYEDPQDIINNIVSGVKSDMLNRVTCEPDRRLAIKKALNMANSGDIVIVAGKGAEKYQEIEGIKYEYNDERYVMELLQSGGSYD